MANLTTFEEWWLNAWPHRWHLWRAGPRFLRACPEPFRGQILEVGAGNGWGSRTILETFPQVELTVTDIEMPESSRLHNLQQQYGRRMHVQQADVLDLPFDRAAFDMVVAWHVMHHVEDVAKAIAQFVRVLRPGGLLGLAEQDQHLIAGPLRWLLKPSNRYGRLELEQLVAREATIRVSEGGAYFYIWAQKEYPQVDKDELVRHSS